MFRISSSFSRLQTAYFARKLRAKQQPMSSSSTWSYDNENDWKHLPGCEAGGQQQSPIDIKDGNVEQADLKPVKLSPEWFNSINGTVINTGTSLRFDVPSDSTPLSAQTNTGVYQLVQFHFHWGPCTGRGSEHTINGTSQDSELHFVLANQDKTKSDFCVLGVLLHEDQSLVPDSKAWQIFSSPPKCNQTVPITNYPVSTLLPPSLHYWYYKGSLTTPPCSEVVNWYVLQQTMPVPSKVLEQWRRMEKDDVGNPLMSNYRAVQSLNGRKISSFTQ